MKKIIATTFLLMYFVLNCLAVSANSTFSIIPVPKNIKINSNKFVLTADTTIIVDSKFGTEQKNLESAILSRVIPSTGFSFKNDKKFKHAIVIKKISGCDQLGTEGYKLKITPEKVLIQACDAPGAFYGIQTFLQLLPSEIYSVKVQKGVEWSVPCCEVTDFPRFKWRGMHIDVSRHFMPPDYIKRFIDLLSIHKQNTFHWHLCDDAGWRIEIKKYPLLTAKGSSGSHTFSYGKPTFYTQQEIKDIVQYARERYVNIVPEIEIPGHEAAAIKAYPQWGATNDNNQLGNVFNIRDKTVDALKQILDEVTELFPSHYIHCGGDEVWASWVWEKDLESKNKAKKLGLKTPHQIQTWLMNEIATHLASKGRAMVGWGEIAGDKLNKNVVVMAWRGTGTTGIKSAKKGFKVVMAPNAYTYFDHRQAPLDKGFGSSVVSLRTVYNYDPANPKVLSKKDALNILGCQGQLWSEMIPNGKRMDYMAFPRAIAMSEISWSSKNECSYNNFKKRLNSHLKILDELNVNYCIPVDFNFDFTNNKLKVTTSIPNLPVYYTTDGTVPTTNSILYTKSINVITNAVYTLRVITKEGRKSSAISHAGLAVPPLKPETCSLEGEMSVHVLNDRKCIGYWDNPNGKLLWNVKFNESGEYNIIGEFSSVKPADMKLIIGKKILNFSLKKPKGWKKPMQINIGSVKIPKAGIYKVILAVGNKKDYAGINMWQINFEKK